MSSWTHLMCAACWNADKGNIARNVNTATEGANSEAEPCCFCDKPTTSGIWVRADPAGMSCRHNTDAHADA